MTGEPHTCTTGTGLPVREPGRVARRLLRGIVWYQRSADGRPSPCRFFPSCSAYAHEAIEVHGAGRGTWLAVRRLLRCRPFGPSGVDLVPAPHDAAHEDRGVAIRCAPSPHPLTRSGPVTGPAPER